MLIDYTTLKSSELRPGMVVMCHGLDCYIDSEIKSKSYDPPQYGCDRVYWHNALVLNRDEVSSDSVPYSFTSPRLTNGHRDEEAVALGQHRWGIQGNDNARWSVLTASLPKN